MKFRNAWLPLFAVVLAVPGAVRAQEDERERPGMIGVSFDVHTSQTDREPDPTREVRIGHVRRGSPAEAAGVDEGDVVIRINGRPAIESYRGLVLREGDTVQFRIRRGDDERDVSIVAAPRPAPETRFGITRRGDGPVVFVGPDSMPLRALTMRIDSLQTRLRELNTGEVRVHMDSLITLFSDSANVFIRRMPSVEFRVQGTDVEGQRFMLESGSIDLRDEAARLAERPFFMELGRRSAAGAELAEMNEGLRRYFDNVQSGALVIDVSPNTPAARAGLEAGDVIVRAGGREVNDPEDVRRALMGEEDGSVPLEVVRQGRRRELTLQWERREQIRELAPSRVRVDEHRRPERTRTLEPTRAPARPRN
jgi:membrane-associated protease RseP (regulator of RpoE activity)